MVAEDGTFLSALADKYMHNAASAQPANRTIGIISTMKIPPASAKSVYIVWNTQTSSADANIAPTINPIISALYA